MKKVLDHTWMNTRGGIVGIALCENDFGQKAYMCVVDGHNESADIDKVCDYGSSLSLSQARGFFGSMVDDSKYGNY